nr:MAG: major capsid protein [Army ant associated microvirus 8]
MKMRSVMKHQFSQVPTADIQRSSFDRSCGYKTTFNSGDLVPFFCDEVLPGDTFKLKTAMFSRLATPVVPFMDNAFLETFYFFVPTRLVWDNWKKFNGERVKPNDSTDYLVPQYKLAATTGFEVGSVADYFGLPYGVKGLSVNALPFRAYRLIYNEWFRDENLQNSLDIPTGDGPDNYDISVLKRNKRHDYFTSCLPWPQKGPAVDIPLGQTANVLTNDKPISIKTGTGQTHLEINDSTTNYVVSRPVGAASATPLQFGSETGLKVDLSSATAVTINSLRQAFQLQKMFERDARGGTRYTEILRSHFRVVSPDARLQRPEYLGGSSQRININPVQQTSATPQQPTPQGNLAAFGLVSDVHHGFNKSFTEHGYIIGILNVRADLTYQKTLNRMWTRQTRFDFFWPALSHLGEQTVLNKEIYCQGTADDDKVFGYQERYAEYRYKPSLITGKMNSHVPTSLDFWHLSQKFDNLPTLSSQFIQENPPFKRVIAVQNEPEFILDAYFNLHCIRPMPVNSVPGLVDHF